MPLLRNPSAAWSKPALTYLQKGGKLAVSARNERYRYTEWPNGTAELWDYQADPGETRNLAADPAYAPVVAEMKPLLRQGG